MASTTTTTTTTTSTTSTTTTESVSPYCTNSDLVAERPNILSHGVSDWSDTIDKATTKINRTLQIRWYNQACTEYSLDYREYPFDPDLLLDADNQLTDLCVYKSLQLIYRYLSKDVPSERDGFAPKSEQYRKLYEQELADVLAQGLSYDWDSSGDLGYTEKYMPRARRLHRC